MSRVLYTMNENLGSDNKIMLKRQFNEHRWFREAVDMGDSGYGYSPKNRVELVSKEPTFKDYEKRMDALVVYWTKHMKEAQSQEELNVWRTQMSESSLLLLDKARHVADPLNKHDSLEALYQGTSQKLVNECSAIYQKRYAHLPKTTNVLQRALWPSTGFGIAAAGVAVSLLIPGAPLFDMIVGAAMLLYSARDVGKKTEDLVLNMQTHQSLAVKEKAGFNWMNALAGLGLCVVGGLTVSGIGSPLSLLLVSIAAFPPILVESLSRVKDYYDTKKAIKNATRDIYQKQEELGTLLDGKDIEAIHQLLATQSEHIFHQEKTSHLEASDVNSMFRKPTHFMQEINRFKQNKANKVDASEQVNDMIPEIVSQNRQ